MVNLIEIFERHSCSSCRQAREWLNENSVAYTERDFFKNPLSMDELNILIDKQSPVNFFSWRSPSVKKMGIERHKVNEEQIKHLILQEPRLLRRPILKVGHKVCIGFNATEWQNAIKQQEIS